MEYNLLFSLPEDLMRKVFEYDPTYHNIFNTKKFRHQLHTKVARIRLLNYFNRNKGKFENMILDSIEYYFFANEGNNSYDYGISWKNEFAYIGNDSYPEDEVGLRVRIKSRDRVSIYFHPTKQGYIYFKILPYKGIDMWKELKFGDKNNTQLKKYDGFFCPNVNIEALKLVKKRSYSQSWHSSRTMGANNPFSKMDLFDISKLFIDKQISGMWMGVCYESYDMDQIFYDDEEESDEEDDE
jgi:hypothetical protein